MATETVSVPNTTNIGALGSQVTLEVLTGERLPLFIRPRSGAICSLPELRQWVGAHRPELDALIVEHGAIVLRGFPVETAADFNQFTELFPAFGGGYIGGRSPRATVVGRAMESTRYAPDLKLNLHQEMAYLRDFPKRIAFFALKPAAEGGETIIGDMREFTRRLPASLVAELQARAVRGVRNFAPPGAVQKHVQSPDAKGWDESFQTTNPSEVEEICRGLGLTPVWEDGRLAVINQLPAFDVHPVTGETIYRNIIHSHYQYKDQRGKKQRRDGLESGTTFGDGGELSREMAGRLLEMLDEVTISWKWQAGDIMLLDNLLVAHGRNPYVGERETLVALLD